MSVLDRILSLFSSSSRHGRGTASKLAAPEAEPLPEEGAPVKCTYCGGTKFFEGPSGGMSTNILCGNEECRHWFNWTPFINRLDDLDRVQPKEGE